ncbi:G/U mismatch-specific DNA glycosylase [Anaeroselena agilis]|uniref:G/U mismatch-specific DNA glycosylase n=1 Tax=Anaeroselena agilis TaxID=3063788 RepID=A0ABU3NTR3_9FIRM|nr:G/U mismatch-specific DNA glycosylase [Selenomonadales bacterium 4137-cl]
MQEVPDIIRPGLTILFIGFNPGIRSAETGHHFAGHSNRFWKLLHASGLTSRQLRPEEDKTLLSLGFGITNIVPRPTKAAAEITREEYRHGRIALTDKLARYRPRIACYAGIGVYREFAAQKDVVCGLQPITVVPDVTDFVVPNPSGLNRMPFADQLRYYKELERLAALPDSAAAPGKH